MKRRKKRRMKRRRRKEREKERRGKERERKKKPASPPTGAQASMDAPALARRASASGSRRPVWACPAVARRRLLPTCRAW